MGRMGTTMPIELLQEAPSADLLRNYAKVSITFTVDSRFRVEAIDRGLGGWKFTEERVEELYEKGLRQLLGRPPGPLARALGHLTLGRLFRDGRTNSRRRRHRRVQDTRNPFGERPRRPCRAVLWYIRVRPERRGEGVGSLMFQRAVEWARERSCERLKGGDPEHQRSRLQILRGPGLRATRHPSQRLPRAAARGPATLVPGPVRTTTDVTEERRRSEAQKPPAPTLRPL